LSRRLPPKSPMWTVMCPMWTLAPTPTTMPANRTPSSQPGPPVAAGDAVVDSHADPVGGDRRMWTRLRLDLGYDGTDFAGWAAQPGQRTVAGVLTTALVQVLGQDAVTAMTVAGRTDAGVHATGQVCHVDVDAKQWPAVATTLLRRLAGLLPADVRVSA